MLGACGLQLSDATNNILNHVLHHIWTSIVFGSSNEKHALCTNLLSSLNSTTSATSSGFCQDEHDVSSIEAKTIQEHAGWVFKRVRDLINAGPQLHKIQISKTNNAEIAVDKHYLQALIERLGKDR